MLDQSNALGIRSFATPDDYGLSLTLGGGEVRLLELAAAYGAFANMGNRVDPFGVMEVTGVNAEVIYRRETSNVKHQSVVDPRVAWLISDILSDNAARAPAFGENSVLRLSRKSAVKTGTTQDFRDNWTVGYTPQLVTGVWVGNADGAPMERISGVSGAGPIWHDVMEIAHRNMPAQWFARPAGLVDVRVCDLSGMLPTNDCAHTRTEWFIEGTQPTQADTWHKRVPTNSTTNFSRVVLDLPSPLQAWAHAQGWPLLNDTQTPSPQPGEGSGERRNGVGKIAIVQPDSGAIFRTAKELPGAVQRTLIEVQLGLADVTRVDVVLQFGQRLAQFDHTPYRTFWNLVPGEHVLIARATLRDGSVVESVPVRVTVRP